MTAPIDLLAHLTALIGPLPDTTGMPHIDPREPDDDEWLSAGDEERLQQAHDRRCTERWGPQV